MRQLGRHRLDQRSTVIVMVAGLLRTDETQSVGESNRGRKADPDREGRTAWGLGGAAPASLDVYGQSSISTHIPTGLLLWVGLSVLTFSGAGAIINFSAAGDLVELLKGLLLCL
jgi:hypothetical protein